MELSKSISSLHTRGTHPGLDNATNNMFSARTAIILIGVAFLMRVGQEIFVPLALSLLLSFTLAPIVSFLRRRSVPKVLAVVVAVTSAVCAIAVFSFIVATQVTNLAANVPTYQRNIVSKVQVLAQAGSGNGVLDHLSKVVEKVGAEIQTRAVESQEDAVPAATMREPMPVEIVARTNPLQTLGNLILPLISPFATAGLVIVLVVFMLLEREDLRDRFIRLVGLSDLHRTTAALQDAGKRVGKYLLMQLVVNALYALPISVGLWILGIPNAILWGLLTLVLRFVPYIGPVIGMILPLFLALAIAPGWSLVAWVAALFLTTELISNNVIEPWLYGSHTGLSPLAIIVSAIFWSWIWGPIGLMLSTPLTVCLVVLGRYVPQFGFLDVLFGNEPVLELHEKLYQRLLAGDPNEATDNAEDYLKDEYLVDYYDKVGLPALLLGEMDRQRGVMTEEQIVLFASSSITLVENLAEIAEQEESEEDPEMADMSEISSSETELPDGGGQSLLCVGGRGAIDDAASAMLSQVIKVQGAKVLYSGHMGIAARILPKMLLEDIDTVVVSFLNENSTSHSRQIIRRMKRLKPSVRVGILIPKANSKIEPEDIGADFIAASFAEAAKLALTKTDATELMVIPRKVGRPRLKVVKPVVADAKTATA